MSAAPRHVLLISLHTCPLEQPGSGDAGGMNVYVRHLAEALVDAGHTVDMATLDRGRGAPAVAGVRRTRIREGLRLLTVSLPGAAGASKEDLPGFTAAFASDARTPASPRAPKPPPIRRSQSRRVRPARGFGFVMADPFGNSRGLGAGCLASLSPGRGPG